MIDDIELRFTHHPPATLSEGGLHSDIRHDFRTLADSLNAVLPDSREKSLAITSLEEGMMWANACVARRVSAPKTAAASQVPPEAPTSD